MLNNTQPLANTNRDGGTKQSRLDHIYSTGAAHRRLISEATTGAFLVA